MSLFPLTSTATSVLDLDEHSFRRNTSTADFKNIKMRNGSYIQGASAPTTPGILSPNLSTYFTPAVGSPGGSVVGYGGYGYGSRSGSSTPRTVRSRRNSNHNQEAMKGREDSAVGRSEGGEEGGDAHASAWMHRTGAALSSETRESKGQSWLVSRASSTNLVDDSWDIGGQQSAVGEDWRGRVGGRGLACAGSRSRSRGVSRDGHYSAGDNGRYTMYSEHALEEDEFDRAVDDEDGTDDEEYLYRERGYGLGMWVDRVIGWSLFSVDDDEEDDEMPRIDPYKESRRKKKQEEANSRALQPPSAVAAAAAPQSPPPSDEDEGWGDPSWVFSIATQILF
ncbi:hypothetical protein BDZ91DRAFT_789128 [Kalaharituber pfeilii]|nr:hypothetical protein BDZ91DRAFT_789128 [Kalaharituber pfeilii]